MPKFMVSAVPIIPIANSMLLQILAACEDDVRNSVSQIQHNFISHIQRAASTTNKKRKKKRQNQKAYLSCANLTAVHYIASHAA